MGEALLAPSVIYVRLIAALLARELPLTYISHITGHGLLKLMRPPSALRYRIGSCRRCRRCSSFLVAEAGLDAKAAYSTFNMGAGYALYCAAGARARRSSRWRRAWA